MVVFAFGFMCLWMCFFVCANVVAWSTDTQDARYLEKLYFDCYRLFRDLINLKLSG